MDIAYNDTSRKAELGDTVHLKWQTREVVASKISGKLMLNIDANQLAPGDLRFIKKLGLTISNPNTESPVAVDEEETGVDTLGAAVAGFFAGSLGDDDSSSSSDDDDDDSGFFSFGGGSSFGDSFGGFGGGGFSGGGASGGF